MSNDKHELERLRKSDRGVFLRSLEVRDERIAELEAEVEDYKSRWLIIQTKNLPKALARVEKAEAALSGLVNAQEPLRAERDALAELLREVEAWCSPRHREPSPPSMRRRKETKMASEIKRLRRSDRRIDVLIDMATLDDIRVVLDLLERAREFIADENTEQDAVVERRWLADYEKAKGGGE